MYATPSGWRYCLYIVSLACLNEATGAIPYMFLSGECNGVDIIRLDSDEDVQGVIWFVIPTKFKSSAEKAVDFLN